MPERERQQSDPQADLNNRSRQLDPEHDAYYQSRGEEGRPEDWQRRRQAEEKDGS